MTESYRILTTEKYQEYQELKEQCDHWHKEAERISHEAIGARLEAITLKKKLDIAVDYLKYIADQEDWNEDLAHCAENALQEIEEVK